MRNVKITYIRDSETSQSNKTVDLMPLDNYSVRDTLAYSQWSKGFSIIMRKMLATYWTKQKCFLHTFSKSTQKAEWFNWLLLVRLG
jgi:hypothetical protein